MESERLQAGAETRSFNAKNYRCASGRRRLSPLLKFPNNSIDIGERTATLLFLEIPVKARVLFDGLSKDPALSAWQASFPH